MPHEVIMPALGMAQDSGLIVAWHRAAGDAVAAGDILLEVETDKATMEIEAATDGFLAELRYQAGQDVPVGEVIAVIAEDGASTEGGAEAAHVGNDAAPAAGASPGAAPSAEAGGDRPQALPEGHEVIMPALGMAQDSGLIVAWHRAAGDAVAAGDILLEVETDKATMEVEAGHDGYLAATLAEAGEDVPVGHAIAVISARAPKTPVTRSLAQSAPAAHSTAAAPAETGAMESPPTAEAAGPRPGGRTPPAAETPQDAGGRILASPKSRRLARERGLDLAALVKMGRPQPYHVADLDALASAPPAQGTASADAEASAFEAEVPAGALVDLEGWLAGETGSAVPRAAILAAFAAGALRAAGQAPDMLVLRCEGPDGAATYLDPDRAGLGALAACAPERPPALILRELSATRLSRAAMASGGAPVLTVTRAAEGSLRLHLACDAADLPGPAAISLLDGLAARLEDPLRHLL